MSNEQLFYNCLRNLEPLVDPFYCAEELIISTSATSPPTPVMLLWTEVRDRLTAADIARRDGDEATYERQVAELDRLLATRAANFLEFTSFFPALDVTYSSFRKMDMRNRLEFLRYATGEYLEKRHRVYLSHGYSAVSVQVRRDFEKHKGSGSSAKRKLEHLLPALGYAQARTLREFQTTRSFVHAEGLLYNQCEGWLRNLGLNFVWRIQHQNKLPDLLVNKDGVIYILECKHMKEVGGGQDKQLSELIDLIRHAEPNFMVTSGYTISYVAFLDGVLFNELADPRAAKMRQQKQDIITQLRAAPGNYFVNTWGLNQLLAVA